MARGVARKGQGKKKAAPPAKALGRKRQAEGLELPAETKAIDPIAPGVKLGEHPAAALFPMMEGGDAADFNADIRAHGVSQAVTLIELAGVRLVLDGRNRLRAARLAGQACPAELYVGSDPVRFVMARNLHRRHLTDGQKSMAAADAETFTHGGVRVGEGKANLPAITREEAAAMAGVNVKSVERAAKVKRKGSAVLADAVRAGKMTVGTAAQAVGLSDADQKRVVDEISAGNARTAKQVIKRGRVQERNAKLKARVVADPTRKYTVILSDDEWKHETWSEQGQDRAADMHYSTSEADELIKRQLAAADNAVYYMWSIVPHQPLAFEVMKARGFTYRSQISWWKIYPGNKPGLGYWSRIEHELLLIGTRGDIACPAGGDNWRSVQLSFAGEHSAKPEWCYRMIEAYHPGLVGTMIEYNARKRRRGWSAWGNEIGLIEPPHSELQAEFEAAPLLPDPDYIDVDRKWFHAMRPKMAAVTMTLAPADKPLSAKGRRAVAALAEAAVTAIEKLPAEEAPENPDLRAVWLIEAGRVGEVAAPDLKRVIAAGYATPGRANRKKGDARPALISAHGAAELKAWRQRVADEAAFDGGDVTERNQPWDAGAEAAHGEEFFKAEADRRGIPETPSVAGSGAKKPPFVPPKFLLADSAERKEATAKRDAKRGAA